jgi:ATP-dependent RNA helicase DHX37/DHR1
VSGPGHCYRLYSSAVYSQRLEQFAAPEVQSLPLEDVVLQMRAMGVPRIDRFPFPSPPDHKAMAAAAGVLRSLGAVDGDDRLTPLGRVMASFPIGVRFAKMMVLARQSGLLDQVIALVAAMSERDPLVLPKGPVRPVDDEEGAAGEEDGQDGEELEQLRRRAAALRLQKYRQWRHPSSDALMRLKAAGAHAFVALSSADGPQRADDFSSENMLHPPTMARILDLRKQLCRVMNK